MATKKVVIKQSEGDPIPFEVLASSIEKIGKVSDDLKNSRIKEKAIVLLLSASSGCSRSTVQTVLNAIHSLRAEYLK